MGKKESKRGVWLSDAPHTLNQVDQVGIGAAGYMSEVSIVLFLVSLSESHRPYLEIICECIITSNFASGLLCGIENELNQIHISHQ